MTSLKSSSRSNSRLVNLKAAVFAAFLTSSICFGAPAATSAVQPAGKPVVPKATPSSKSGFENHQDLILKAQNLTLQRDRLQTSQILIRGIQRETRGSPAYKDLTKALSDLTTVFYTEKAQSVFSVGEANVESKPKDAVESFQEALRIEDGNVTILKALARVQLSLGDCEKADATLRSAEALDPYSAEVKLLNLQSLACAKSFDALLLKVEAPDIDFENAEVFVKNLRTGLQVQSLLNLPKPKQDLKKVKTVLTTLETQMPDYPEVHFWKWELSKAQAAPDRTSAMKYAQACQNLSARKRKNYSLDVNLCKEKEAVEAYLKSSGLSTPPKEI